MEGGGRASFAETPGRRGEAPVAWPAVLGPRTVPGRAPMAGATNPERGPVPAALVLRVKRPVRPHRTTGAGQAGMTGLLAAAAVRSGHPGGAAARLRRTMAAAERSR